MIDKLLDFSSGINIEHWIGHPFCEHSGWEHTDRRYNYRHLRNDMCYWEKPRYCPICLENTLKHYKPLLKERDKWIAIQYGIIRIQSAYPDVVDNPTYKTRLHKYEKPKEEHPNMTDEELNNLFCEVNGHTDKDFSWCKNDCERREWSDGSTISFRYKKPMMEWLREDSDNVEEKQTMLRFI